MEKETPKKCRYLSEEHKVKLRMAKLRNPVKYWLGKKRPDIIEKCRKASKGKKHTIQARINMSKAQKKRVAEGKNNLWKGGITRINKKLRNSLEYKLWREAVFKRDNHTCIWCGEKSRKGKRVELNADHIKPFALFPELRFALDNGRTLCIDCHETTETFKGKISNYDVKSVQSNTQKVQKDGNGTQSGNAQ